MHHFELKKKTYNSLNTKQEDISFHIKEKPYNHLNMKLG
jgi:hypothetical protein